MTMLFMFESRSFVKRDPREAVPLNELFGLQQPAFCVMDVDEEVLVIEGNEANAKQGEQNADDTPACRIAQR